MTRVAINGLGRIGRAAFKLILDTPGLELVAVNDIGELDNMAYLLKFDTVYGPYKREVTFMDGALVVDGQRIDYLSERDPANLPWRAKQIDLVFECTGLFTKEPDARKHLDAGAKRRHPFRPDEQPGDSDRRAWREPGQRRRAHYLHGKLHDQRHHPGDGNHQPAHRREEGHDDHDPRLHRHPIPGGRARR